MKFLKLLLFLVLIVLIAGTLYFATQDGSYQIESTREINAPKEVVYDIVNEYKTWEEWGPWKKEDPTMVFNYAEKTSGEGASYTWQGEMDGGMNTTQAIPHSHIEQRMTLDTPGGERNPEVYWDFKSTENPVTKVTWGITGDHTLMDKVYYAFSGMDFNGDMKKMFEKGLDGLEEAARKEINKYSINIDGITQYSGGFYLSRTTSAKAQAVAQIMSQNYGGIKEFMKENNIVASGMPFTIYNETFENGDVIMTNAVPVREKIVVAGANNVLSGYTPTVTAVKATMKGNYTNLGEAWTKVMQQIKDKGYTLADEKPFEVYVTDPQNNPNPADWITEIYVPIKDLE
ncbi:SRPBCC family protein [Dokdonia sp. Hel_I_53]|uniref:SRPBCC family protein n=1 Tax=Dokdonia sp. Hel_I_53 TaxID=1566287 RepID=UPI00119A9E7E|nr:SRPBCC family protein [Dokdonia sp. Hel_I_53]TVZ51651.1 effector-binding domain-containing protein [Dokdonia sp. Hel_I_53]